MTSLPNSPHIITLSKIFQSRDNFSLKINKVYENTILRSQKEITLKHFAMTFSPVIFKSLLKRFAKRPPKHTAKRKHQTRSERHFYVSLDFSIFFHALAGEANKAMSRLAEFCPMATTKHTNNKQQRFIVKMSLEYIFFSSCHIHK